MAKAVVAAGHDATANAAEEVLRAGGNAFDAIVAAFFTACVAEPVLASLGGGGYLTAYSQRKVSVLDFFVQTPLRKYREATDFHPIHANFGATTQEFHIGTASIATPGAVKGMFEIHSELGTMPMSELLSPAVTLARKGIRLNTFQAYIFDIVKPIFTATRETQEHYQSPADEGKLLQKNDLHVQPELADLLESLGLEGEDLFYRGEVASRIEELCRIRGGHLTRHDLEQYRTDGRRPLRYQYGKADFVTNPPPSSGGALIAFALQLMDTARIGQYKHGSHIHLSLLAEIMNLTNKARIDADLQFRAQQLEQIFEPALLERYKKDVLRRAAALRGTTHMSVMDVLGNVASLTTSNGEGCGHILPGTGVMLNNMLGEEDLNPAGFHQWRPGQRMTSMMAPSLVFKPDHSVYAFGSGGSNRLRTAILQVMSNILDFGMSVEDAVNQPRLHVENGNCNIEAGYPEHIIERVGKPFEEFKVWPEHNLFFGGAHTIARTPRGLEGAGDPRRGGVVRFI